MMSARAPADRGGSAAWRWAGSAVYLLVLAVIVGAIWYGYRYLADPTGSHPQFAAGPSTGEIAPPPPPVSWPTGAPMPLPLPGAGIGTATDAAASAALNTLRENAAYWTLQGRFYTAFRQWLRVLTIVPNDVDALAAATVAAFAAAQYEAAEELRARLERLMPNHPELARLRSERRFTQAELDMLATARQLVAADRKDEALAQYTAVFRGSVPPALAKEYYYLLAGVSPEGLEEATAGMRALIQTVSHDRWLRLSFAQLLTFREGTRPEGISILRELAQSSPTDGVVRGVWRQALLWQGASFDALQQLDEYLARYPTDEELVALRTRYIAALPTAEQLARERAFEALKLDKPAEAEREFRIALAANPDDGPTMLWIALMLRKQGKGGAEERALIARGLVLAGEAREEFEKILGMRQEARSFADPYPEIERLMSRGEFAVAEQRIRRLMGPRGDSNGYALLGLLKQRANRLAEAEVNYRRALQLDPRNANAMMGLGEVLNGLNQRDEAAAMFTHAEELFRNQGGSAGQRGADRARAAQLRIRARAETDLEKRLAIYQDAILIDPDNPWLRLEYARALRQHGKPQEGRQTMLDMVTVAQPQAGAVRAALLFAQEAEDDALLQDMIARLPPAERDEQVNSLGTRAAVRAEINRVAPLSSTHVDRYRLLGLAGRNDPDGHYGTEVARALLRRNDIAGVELAVQAALANTRTPTARQRLAYAEVLLQARLTTQAQRMAESAFSPRMSEAEQARHSVLLDGVAVQRAYALNEQGKAAEAYDVLTARLRHNPRNVALNAALSATLVRNRQTGAARSIADGLLRRDSMNLEARQAAVQAAAAAGDYDRADELLQDGMQLHPNEPRIYMMSADYARQRGQPGRALRYLEIARDLRARQLDTKP